MGQLNAFSTALEALKGQDLKGKTVLITGANQGIGLETVRVLAVGGANVYMTSRNLEKGEKAAEKLRGQNFLSGKIYVLQLDLMDLKSIHHLVDEFKSRSDKLHILICNGGISATNGLQYTKYGFEQIIGTNHYGHFALIQGLQDAMAKQDFPSRIIILASDTYMLGHIDPEKIDTNQRKASNSFFRYANSKLANILISKVLAKRLQDTKVKVFSLHPGIIFTNMPTQLFGFVSYLRPFLESGLFINFLSLVTWGQLKTLQQGMIYTNMAFTICPNLRFLQPYLTSAIAQWVLPILSRGLVKNFQQGAATTVYAATAQELDPYSGAFIQNCQITSTWKKANDLKTANRLYEMTEKQLSEAENIFLK